MGLYVDEVIADAPVLYHRLEGNGSSIGSQNPSITVVGGVTYETGRYGQGVRMNTEGSSLEYPLPTDLYSNEWTIEAWFKSNHAKYYNNICRISHGNGSRHIGLRVRGSNHAGNARPNVIELFTYDGVSWGDVQTPSNINANNNQWHHVVVKAEGTGTLKYLYMFLDGVKYAYSAGGDAARYTRTLNGLTGVTQRIGAGPDPGGVEAWTNGTLDEVALYNKALSDERIMVHWNNRDTGPFRGWGLPL